MPLFKEGKHVSVMKKLIKLWPSEEQKSALYVSGKLSTYPSPKPTLTLSFHSGQNVGLGEG